MNLKKGSKGTEVEELQKLLNDAGGYNLKTDGIFGDKTLAAVKDYQTNNGLKVDGIAGVNTMTKLKGTSATPSTTPSAAPVVNTTTPTMPSAPTAPAPQDVTAPTQNATYADQINATVQQILSRQPMQYNFNGDPLYQMYKDAAMQNSQIASADAMARASALTGGYGNSYAATVGNQVAQQQMATLNEKIPELEEIARARYDAETNRLTDNLGILSALENQEYTRKWDEEQRDYERKQDDLDREFALAELSAQFGDLSGLKKLGIDTSKYVVGGDAPIDDETSKWIYNQYLSYMKAQPPSDDATATRWAQNIVNAYLDGRLSETHYFTLIDKYSNVKRIAQEYARRKKNELTANESMTMPTPDLIAKLNEWQKNNKK